MTKIISYNVNGIRAALRKGFLEWLRNESPDILCIQELKANPDQFDTEEFQKLGYNDYWFPAQKKGYSGVALLCKKKPTNIKYGCDHELFDSEGRVLQADFDNFSVLSTYFPSRSGGDHRQNLKMQFLDYFGDYAANLSREKNIVISGDVNICREAIDIHDPVGNKKSSGFLPEEREWFADFLDKGFSDSYRNINPEKIKYSWWSYRAGARKKNKGWRIDYHLLSDNLKPALKSADIHNEAEHSDHCPILVELDV